MYHSSLGLYNEPIGDVAPEPSFDFAFYWDSVAEMSSFLEASKRVKRIVPPYADVDKIHCRLSAQHRAGARLRCRRRTLLAVYQKAMRR